MDRVHWRLHESVTLDRLSTVLDGVLSQGRRLTGLVAVQEEALWETLRQLRAHRRSLQV